jgi:hypothetical protein
VGPLRVFLYLRVRVRRVLSESSMFFGLARILFNIDHTSGGQTGPAHAAQVSCCGQTPLKGRWQYGRMKKKKRVSKGPAGATLAGIKREMQEPRLTKSVRDDPRYQVVLAA